MNLGEIAVMRKAITGTLDLNFAAGTFNTDSKAYASASLVPGFSCARTGTIGVQSISGAISWFAPNIIPVTDYGLHSYEAMTNIILQSQGFDTASWAKTNATMTADAIAAPDGTNTADLLTTAATGITKAISQTKAVTPNTAYTAVFYVKKGTALNSYKYSVFDATNGANIIARTDYYAQIGADWTRVTLTFTTPATCTQIQFYPVNAALSEHNVTIYLWQAQIVAGNFPVGGPPLISSDSAVGSIGLQDLRFGLSNGNKNATYTFDDNSTQVVPVVIAGGVFKVGTYPTNLNRPRIKRIQVA